MRNGDFQPLGGSVAPLGGFWSAGSPEAAVCSAISKTLFQNKIWGKSELCIFEIFNIEIFVAGCLSHHYLKGNMVSPERRNIFEQLKWI